MSAIHSTVNGILMTNLANYGGPTCYFCCPNSAETYTVDCENVRWLRCWFPYEPPLVAGGTTHPTWKWFKASQPAKTASLCTKHDRKIVDHWVPPCSSHTCSLSFSLQLVCSEACGTWCLNGRISSQCCCRYRGLYIQLLIVAVSLSLPYVLCSFMQPSCSY